MKITIGTYVVCTGLGSDDVKSWDDNSASLKQKADGLRAPSSKWFDRLNESNEIAFTLSRTNASLLAAQFYCMQVKLLCPRQGNVTFLLTDPASGATQAVYLPNAVISVVRNKFMGIETEHTFTVSGGAFQTTPPS